MLFWQDTSVPEIKRLVRDSDSVVLAVVSVDPDSTEGPRIWSYTRTGAKTRSLPYTSQRAAMKGAEAEFKRFDQGES